MRRTLAALAFLVGLLPGLAAAQAPPAVPALPDTERRTSFSLSSSTCACSIGFALYGTNTDIDQWIQVYVGGIRYLSNDANHGWGLTSATGSLATIPRPITNAVLTFTSAQTATVQVVGAERPRRLTQFAENRGVAARDLNLAFTDLEAQNRETWDRSLRALLAPPGETIGLLPAQTTRAGGVLGFDSSGNPIAIAALTGLGNVVGPNVSVVGHIATFGNTAGTILLDGGLVGAGDVTGPASSTDNHAATFNGAGGKTIKDSGLTLTASTGTFTLTNAKTLAVTNTLTLSGTDSTTITFQGTDTYVGRATTDTLTNKTFDTAGTGNSFSINGLAATANTGTGAMVRATAPTMTAPVLGSASATSLATATIYPPSDSTTAFQIRKADATTRVIDVDTTNARVGINKTPGAFDLDVAGAVNGGAATFTTVNGLAVTTSTGTLTVANGKTLTFNNTGTFSGGDSFTLAIAASKTLTVSNSLTFTGTDGTSFAFPSTSDTVATLAAAQTFTSKTLTAPTINGGTHTAITSLGIRSTGTGAFDLTIANSENLTAARTLTLTVNNASRTISLSGNLTLASDFTTAGPAAITLTATGATNVTLPTSGTLATIDTAQTFSASNIFSALTQFSDIKLSSGHIYPTVDGTTALQLCKADGTTCIARIDTTNSRIGINKNPGAFDLDINGAVNVGGILTFGTLSPTSLAASITTITGLTVNNSPSSSNDYLMYYSAADGAIRKCTVGSCAAAATAGVSSLNGLTGGLSIVGGNFMSVSAAGTSVTVTSQSSPTAPQLRLTLTTGTPVTTTDVTGATAHFCTPFLGTYAPITTDGTTFIMTAMSEMTQTTADTTKSPAAVANNSVYDVLLWSDGGTIRCTRGPAWSSDTSRGTGAGTAEIDLTTKFPTNKVAVTNGPTANRGVVIGSFRSNGSAQLTDSTLIRWVSNIYNATPRSLQLVTGANASAYSTATWKQWNSSTANQVDVLQSLGGGLLTVQGAGTATNSAANNYCPIAIGVDSTTAPSGLFNPNQLAAIGNGGASTASYSGALSLGRHYAALLEYASGGTCTQLGNQTVVSSGLTGQVLN